MFVKTFICFSKWLQPTPEEARRVEGTLATYVQEAYSHHLHGCSHLIMYNMANIGPVLVNALMQLPPLVLP